MSAHLVWKDVRRRNTPFMASAADASSVGSTCQDESWLLWSKHDWWMERSIVIIHLAKASGRNRESRHWLSFWFVLASWVVLLRRSPLLAGHSASVSRLRALYQAFCPRFVVNCQSLQSRHRSTLWAADWQGTLESKVPCWMWRRRV